MTDDRWRDSYDAWKLRSPYDDAPEVDCDHAEYDVDWEGRARCDHCGEHWYLTSAELQAHEAAEARWMEEYDRLQRREHSPFWRTVDWLRALLFRVRSRLRKPPPVVDDLPF